MQDIWEPSLDNRISSFINRKANKFPELGLKTKSLNFKYSNKKRNLEGSE